MRRGNQSPLPGPAAPVEAALLFDSAAPDTWIVEMVSTLDGMLVVPECGRILAFDRASRALRWQRDLVAGGHKVLPLGLTVDLQGQVLATGIECPDVAGGLRTGMFVVRPDGANLVLVPQGSSYSGPAIGPDGAVYTLDESTLLRAYEPWFTERWMTDLAGYSNRGLAVDSRGNLYAGTDGGRMHQASLWSIRPKDGEIRWRAASEDLGLPAIGGDDTVYVAARTGTVHAFTPEGQERWARAVGAISSGRPLAIGRSGTIYVHATTDLVALRPDGTRKWTFTPGRGTTEATPILDGDENVYAAFGRAVYCLAAKDGRVRWSLPIAEPDVIILGEAGTLYVVSEHRRVYAVTSAPEGTAGIAGTPSPGRAPR
jgi:outer membrane protein assembly factor BamB